MRPIVILEQESRGLSLTCDYPNREALSITVSTRSIVTRMLARMETHHHLSLVADINWPAVPCHQHHPATCLEQWMQPQSSVTIQLTA
jgi:hypothetical protein